MNPDQIAAAVARMVAFSLEARETQTPDSSQFRAFIGQADKADLQATVWRLVGICSTLCGTLSDAVGGPVAITPNINAVDFNGGHVAGALTLRYGGGERVI